MLFWRRAEGSDSLHTIAAISTEKFKTELGSARECCQACVTLHKPMGPQPSVEQPRPTHFTAFACMLLSCPTLGDPMDCSPPGSSVHGILQARTLEWVRDLSDSGLKLVSLAYTALAGGFFTTSATWEALSLPLPFLMGSPSLALPGSTHQSGSDQQFCPFLLPHCFLS